MGIKEELQKIIDAEREKLAAQDLIRQADLDRNISKFAVLAGLLREFCDTLGHQYCSITFDDDIAIINFEKDYGGLEVFICPNGDCEGFMVQSNLPIPGPSDRNYSGGRIVELSTEEAVMECLLRIIGNKAARMQHENAKREKFTPKLP